MSAEREMAQQLAASLNQRNYNGKSVLDTYIETEVKTMAQGIAAEVVAGTPALADVIRERTTHAIQAALRDDPYLNQIMTTAVAKALTDYALERRDGGDS